MTSIDIDDRLREQSKLLLQKLKEKQGRLQNAINSSRLEESTTDISKGENSTGLNMRPLKEKSCDWQSQQGSRPDSNKTTVKECLDTSLKKTLPAKSNREVRSRLQRRRTQSRDQQNQLILKGQPGSDENKENLKQACQEKQVKSKDIETVETTDVLSRESNDNAELLAKISGEVEAELVNGVQSDTEVEAKAGATPNTIRRRKIIDRNVRVNGGTDLNVSELMQEVEDEFPRLNYSYSNVEDTDLKFLQDRFGPKGEERSAEDDVPVKDVGAGAGEKYSDNLENPGNSRKFAKYIRDSKKPKSILLSTSQRPNKSSINSSRVSFRSPTRDASGNVSYPMDRESRENQRMLGYDWIAGLLENDPNGVNQSETFFEELKEFRKFNLEECVNNMYMTGPQELWEHPEREPLPVQKALEETSAAKKSLSEVKPYMVNERLFPEPIQRSLWADYDNQEPHLRQEEREGTYEEPRFVRVSIPRSTLQQPSRVKPHRRNSFEAADSMALSEHCLKGCNTTKPTTMPAASNIGLRNATLGIKNTMKTTLDDAETLAANYPYEWNPADQSICRPLPRPTYRPESSYLDASWPVHVRADPSSFSHSSATLKKATDDLLNSTHSLMYEMQRLKTQR